MMLLFRGLIRLCRAQCGAGRCDLFDLPMCKGAIGLGLASALAFPPFFLPAPGHLEAALASRKASTRHSLLCSHMHFGAHNANDDQPRCNICITHRLNFVDMVLIGEVLNQILRLSSGQN